MRGQEIDVVKIGELANLEFSPEESAKLKREFGLVMDYVRKVMEVDVSGIEPTVYGGTVQGVLREDVPQPCLDRETALKNAPQRIEGEFKVPRIVE